MLTFRIADLFIPLDLLHMKENFNLLPDTRTFRLHSLFFVLEQMKENNNNESSKETKTVW